MSKTYGLLKSSMKQEDKTLRGSDWIESHLMNHDVKVIMNMDEDGITNIYLKERNDTSGDNLIAWFKLLPDGTMIPQ
jgi:hypothetical protein